MSQQYYREEKVVLEHLSNLSEYESIYVDFHSLFTQNAVIRDKKTEQKINKIIRNPLLKNINKALSLSAKLVYCQIITLYAWQKGNYRKAIEASRQQMLLIETSPSYIISYPHQYLNVLNTCIHALCYTKRFAEALEYLSKINHIQGKTAEFRARKFFRASVLEIFIHNHSGEFSRATERIGAIILEMEKFGNQQIPKNNQAFLYFIFGTAFFGAGKYSKALFWFNKLTNEIGFGKIRVDLYLWVQILTLFIHYEMKKYELLPYALGSIHRFLYKKQSLYKFEETILKFIRKKLARIEPYGDHKTKLIKAFRELHKDILKISKDPLEGKVLDNFDLLSWLESKIENRSFEEVIRQKAISK